MNFGPHTCLSVKLTELQRLQRDLNLYSSSLKIRSMSSHFWPGSA